MTRFAAARLFGPVIGWSIFTGIFAWLPLVRILGRPDGYTWGILGLRGAGTEGPFWIFIVLTAYVLTMLFTAHRGPRAVSYPMLIVWHTAVTILVVAGVVLGGTAATWQGQGLHFSIPMWTLVVPFALFTALVVAWVVADARSGETPGPARWTRANTVRLAASIGLLVVALVLFRAGTNYNWITAAAILTTIVHWILLAESFAVHPAARRGR
jgi:hypothetical protein